MNRTHPRNGALFDNWSIVHLVTGGVMGWLMNPWIALLLMAAWEPLEIFILSPLLAKLGIEFGYETWRNSISDIFFDIVGILIGYFLLSQFATPPFRLWS